MGLLDNIIPPEEPTYDLYTKLGWKSIEELIGDSIVNGDGDYMVFIPSSVTPPDLKDKLLKLLYKVKKKRSVIDMHDNESMVKRTIEEFESVYNVLEKLFEIELSTGIATPFMRFMFTKFVTKVLGFQRRITTLLGFTGGESLNRSPFQIELRTSLFNLIPYGTQRGGRLECGEKRALSKVCQKISKRSLLCLSKAFPFTADLI
jgi:hypothetical protein